MKNVAGLERVRFRALQDQQVPTGGTARSETNGSPDPATSISRAGIHGSSLENLEYQKLEISQAWNLLQLSWICFCLEGRSDGIRPCSCSAVSAIAYPDAQQQAPHLNSVPAIVP